MAGLSDEVPLGPAGVEVTSEPNVGSYEAPQTNPALQLASSLAEVEPKADDFVTQLGAQLRAKDEAAAHTAALQSSAKSYKDAVSSGQLPGAASPWYIQQFNQDRAEIQFRDLSTQTIAASQQWQERAYQDGGVAYEARLQKEIGGLRQQVFSTPGMHAVDAQIGFDKGARPLLSQAIAENDRYQTQSIQLQKQQDSTTLIEQGIADAYKQNPTAKPADVLTALEPQFQRMEAVGFQKSDVARMAFNAILGAGYNAMDGSIIHDLSTTNFRGGTPLSLIAGEDGKPYGEQIGYADYRIEMEAHASALNETKARTAQIQQEGSAASELVKSHFGWGLLDGSTTPDQMMSFMKTQGVSVEGAMEASRQLNSEFEGVVGVNKSLVAVNETNPQAVQTYLSLADKIANTGLGGQDASVINLMVAMGQLSPAQAQKLVDQGIARNNTLTSEARADARTSREIQQETTRDHHQEVTDAITLGSQVRENNEGDVQNLLLSKGDVAVVKDPQVAAQLKRVGDAAYRSYLAQHPPQNGVEDYQGAGQAQRAALANWASKRLSHIHPANAGLAQGPAN